MVAVVAAARVRALELLEGREPLPHVLEQLLEVASQHVVRGQAADEELELDRVGPQEAALASDFYQRTVALELAFFDAVYPEGK